MENLDYNTDPFYSYSSASTGIFLNKEQLIYLAAMVLLAVRGGKITNEDIEQAGRSARGIYSRLVESK